MTIGPGSELGERYELGHQIGSGGMATVYLAYDTVLDREVAVKVLAERFAADQAFVERFRREASAAARARSSTVCPDDGVGSRAVAATRRRQCRFMAASLSWSASP